MKWRVRSITQRRLTAWDTNRYVEWVTTIVSMVRIWEKTKESSLQSGEFSHNLKIETNRYTEPPTPQEERVCSECKSFVEDKHHVVFQCPLCRNIETQHRDLFLRLKSIPELLNPKSKADASEVGDMLLSINSIWRDLGLCQWWLRQIDGVIQNEDTALGCVYGCCGCIMWLSWLFDVRWWWWWGKERGPVGGVGVKGPSV